MKKQRIKSGLKLISAVLAIVLLASQLCGAFAFAEGNDSDTGYKLSTELTEGSRYVIAAEYEGKYYAFNYTEAGLGAEELAVEGDTALSASDAAIWFAREDNTIENAGTPGTFIYAGSYGLMTYSTGRTFVYDDNTHTILMHNLYYLTFDGSAFGQSKDAAEAYKVNIYGKADEEGKDFELSSELTEGNKYVITTEYEGKTFAFDYTEAGLGAEEVDISDNIALPASDAAIWFAREDNALENAGTPGTFIYAGSYGLMTYSTGRTFVYDDSTHTILMHNLYYLTFDGTAFGQSKDAGDACAVRIYEKYMPKSGSDEKYIPDGSDLPSINREAVKNSDGSITLAFVSDVHYSVDYEQNNLQVWLENIEKSVGYIDAIGFCGDMGSAYSPSADAFWTNTQAIIDYMDTKVADGAVGETVYTFGNHEWYPSAGGDFMNNYENATAKRFLRVGEAIRTDDYIFYCFGAGSIASKLSQGYSEEDIARIDAYLSTAPTDIPIFVLTHFPVHFWGDRLTSNADKLIEVFNKYPNIVVLWGHNHSDFDEYYDTVYNPGDEIVIDNKGTSREINFTYMTAGCISDFEYTGPGGGSAWVQGKGLIVTISASGSLSYDFYTMDGQKMSENGPFLVEFRDGVTYDTLKWEYVENGNAATAPEASEHINYTFTGWDTSFDAITGHTVVTSQYDYTPGLDSKYIYLTIMLGDSVAVGQSGTPIVLYPIEYTPNLNAVNAVKALQNVEFAGGGDGVAAGGRGYLTSVWGITSENGVWLMDPESANGYTYATTALTPGSSYYIYVPDSSDDTAATSFIAPFCKSVKAGDNVQMIANYWKYNSSNYSFALEPIDGAVLIGKTIDSLNPANVECVNGEFTLSVSEPGDYYVAVKSDNAALAITKITVAKPVVQPTAQKITLNGEEITLDVYNIDGYNYFKLRDLACSLSSTDGKFEVAYDEASRQISITTGEGYTAIGNECSTGDDNSASAVRSSQPLYIDGTLKEFGAYNIGGFNYFKLRDLGEALGFGVDYDEATNTAQITA